VQTGVGRTGTWFGYQHDGVEPNVMTLAKGLAGGVPIGAMVASERAAAGLAAAPGGAVPHASTFGGNALACAAARTVLDVVERDGLLEACRATGDYLGAQLDQLAARHPDRCEGTRGRGLLRGLVLRENAAPLVARCREQGLLLSITGANVVRFAPALIVGRAHVDEAVALLDGVLRERRAA
jgi:acetylornithine/succinyldiaminopimelate/putrescine aminotransferase